ncbi:MAG: gliding motility-associated protein GldE [Bacteroidetes bacterium]|nr:gliding motility-associated protein GldE [Bacteroidota bacterium]
MLILLLFSALVSGSEVAYFSLSPGDMEELKNSESNVSETILELLQTPKRLLATILIANNFINVSIIILSTVIIDSIFDYITNPTTLFLIQVVVVTFLILLIGEVIPKVYANSYQKKLAIFMAYPLVVMQKIFWPISFLLVYSTRLIDKRIKQKGHSISVNDLSHALELTDTRQITGNEKLILKGIVKFGNTDVKQIMTSRVNVSAIDYDTGFQDLLYKIVDYGFSRIPVYVETFDHISGILYIKDVLPFLNEEKTFEWQKLLRPPFFVPENKKIDDLLKEFQTKKTHLAVVVDEYGGTSGVVTLEDIMEEIVGEISDEFDEDELAYSKLDDYNYIFEGQTALNDLYRVLNIDGDQFEEEKGDSDTLAGFILELEGKFPEKGAEINFQEFTFKIESVDSRRIKMVKLTINQGLQGLA